MIDLIEVLGVSAGLCTCSAFIPQLRKILVTRSTKDISLNMYIIYCVGLILWTTYGFFISSFAVVLSNIITLILSSCILTMKLRWDVKT